MEPPDDLDKCLFILILRVVGCSQEDTAAMARCAKQTVGRTEDWFQLLPYREAVALCDDQVIKSRVGQELVSPEERVDPKVIAKATQITGDRIISHYRDDYLSQPRLRVPDTILEKHFCDLAEVAKRVIDMVLIPEPCNLWVEDLRYGKPQIQDEYGLEWSWRPEDKKMTVDFVDLSQDESLERQIFFQPLMSHMTDLGTQYQQLKDILAEYIQKCHEFLYSIVRDGKQEITKLAKDRATYPEQLEEFAQAKLGKIPLFLDYGGKGGGLVVYRHFFTTAYHNALFHAQHREAEAPEEYEVDPG